MTHTTKVSAAVTSLDTYKLVQDNKTHQEKDSLIVHLVESGLHAAWADRTAMEASQLQLEAVEAWCMAPPSLTPGQRELVGRLLAIPGIKKVCLLSQEPVFDLYVAGDRTDSEVYDEISAAVVDYKYDYRASAAYMYMTMEELAACDTRGIRYLYFSEQRP